MANKVYQVFDNNSIYNFKERYNQLIQDLENLGSKNLVKNANFKTVLDDNGKKHPLPWITNFELNDSNFAVNEGYVKIVIPPGGEIFQEISGFYINKHYVLKVRADVTDEIKVSLLGDFSDFFFEDESRNSISSAIEGTLTPEENLLVLRFKTNSYKLSLVPKVLKIKNETSHNVTINLYEIGIVPGFIEVLGDCFENHFLVAVKYENGKWKLTNNGVDWRNILTDGSEELKDNFKDFLNEAITIGDQFGITVTYNKDENKLDFNVHDFRIKLQGFITGEGLVTNLQDVVINTFINDLQPLKEALEESGLDADTVDGKHADDFMPNPYNLPVGRAGDSSFLEIPVYTDYEGSAYPFGTRDYLYLGSDGRVYIYSVRTNFVKQRVYIGYIDKELNEYNLLSQEYRPPFLSSDEYIDWILDGNEWGMTVRVRKESDSSYTRWYWIHFNGTENPVGHTYDDITQIANGSYWSVVYCKEFDVWIKGYYKGNGVFNYQIYDRNFNLLLEQTGIRWDASDESEVNYPPIIHLGVYHTGYTQLNYKVENNKILLKNFICIWISYFIDGARTRKFAIKDFIEFDMINNQARRIVSNLPLDPLNPDHEFLELTDCYCTRFKPYKIGSNYVLVTETTCSNSYYRQILQYKESYDYCFDNDFHFFRNPNKTKTIFPLDNSPIGKQIYNAAIVSLPKNGYVQDFVICEGAGVDPESKQIKRSLALIEGFSRTNPENYTPTAIRKLNIPKFPYITYIDSNNPNVTHVFTFSFEEARGYTSYENLIQDIPNVTANFDNIRNKVNNILNEYVHEFLNVNPIKTDTRVYWIPYTDKMIVVLGCIYPGNEKGKYNLRNAVCLMDKNTGERLSPFHVYYSLENYANMRTYAISSCWPSLTCYYDVNERMYYVWFNGFGYLPLGSDVNTIIRWKIPAENSPQEPPVRFYIGIPNWTYPNVFVHSFYKFCLSDAFAHQYLAVKFSSTEDKSSFQEAWNSSPSDGKIFATIRSAVGFNITISEFPVMLNGRYQKTDFTYIEDLKPNTKYYVYVTPGDEKANIVLKTTFESPLPNKLFLGWFETDNVGVKVSDFSKSYLLQSIQITQDGNIEPLRDGSVNLGSPSKRFNEIHTKQINTTTVKATTIYEDNKRLAYKDLSNVSDSTVLNKVKAVDGSGSGLDADLWDGGHKTISTSNPSGGHDGDVWFKIED